MRSKLPDLSRPRHMPRATRRDELRATLDGELRRARERAHELGVALAILGKAIPSALDPSEGGQTMAVRLQSIVVAGSAALSELAMVAGKLGGLGALEVDL